MAMTVIADISQKPKAKKLAYKEHQRAVRRPTNLTTTYPKLDASLLSDPQFPDLSTS